MTRLAQRLLPAQASAAVASAAVASAAVASAAVAVAPIPTRRARIVLASPPGARLDHLAAALSTPASTLSLCSGTAAEVAAVVEAMQPDVVVAHLDLFGTHEGLLTRLATAGALASVVVVAPASRHLEVMHAVRDGALAWLAPHADADEVARVLRRAIDAARTWQRVLGRIAQGDLDTDEVLRPADRPPRRFDAEALRWQPVLCPRSGAVEVYEALSWEPTPALPELTSAMRRHFGPRPPPHLAPDFLEEVAAELHACAPLPRIMLHVAIDELERSWLGTASDPLREIADRVVLALDDHRQAVRPQRLAVEVQRLRAEGYRFALTALGAGRDQLAMQLVVQPELFKLRHETLEGCEVEPRKARHVKTLVALAHATGARVVGEGISTAQEARLALDLGCDLLQGDALAPAAGASAWRDGVTLPSRLARLVQ